MNNSQSKSYADAGVDITAGYKAVELMKKHVARTRNEGSVDDVGGFGGCFDLSAIAGMEHPISHKLVWLCRNMLPYLLYIHPMQNLEFDSLQ